MDNNFLPGNDLRAEFILQLLGGSATVAAGGDQNSNIGLGISLTDLGQHPGHDDLTGDRAGMVTGDRKSVV